MKEVPVSFQNKERIAPVPTAPDRDFSADRNRVTPPAEVEHRERVEALQEWTRRYLEERFPEYGPDTESNFIEHCRQSGFEEVLSANRPGDAASEADRRNISIGSIATETFLHEVINIMREHSDDREVIARFQESLSENSRLDRWALKNLDDTGFISVYTDYERSAGISKLAVETPFPLMRTYFADRLANIDESSLKKLADGLSERSPGERIDIIRFLPVPISLDEDGFEPPKNVREEYRKRFRFVLERLADTDIATIRFSALNRLADQEAYWYKCDEAGGEAFLEYEEVSSKKEADLPKSLERRIVPDRTLPYHYFAGRVATDAIAFFDGPGFPRYIAHAPSERLDRFESEAPSTDWSAIANLRRELRKMPFNSITEIHYVLSEVEKALFEEEMRPDSDSLAREFSKISNALDEPFWKAYFELKKELYRLLEEDWEQTQTLERNFEVKQDVLKAQIEEITRKHKEGQSDGSGLAETLPETIHSLLKQDTTDLNEHLGQTFQSRAQNKELEETEKHIDTLLDEILTRSETFRRDLLTYLDRKLESAEEAGAFIKTHLNSYEKIQKDPTLDPFGAIDPESLRLIQALHSPDAKDSLGMDFTRLPLRAQIHFLSFRGKEDSAAAERFRLALGKHEDISDDLAYSFLATAESPEYGETILSLAERLDTETLGPILRKYAEITKDADTISDYVRESFPNLKPEDVGRETLAISKNLLRRGRDLLVDFSKSTDADPETLLRKLGDVSAGVELYKKTFRQLFEKGLIKSPAEMVDTEIEAVSPEYLDEETKEWMRGLYRKSYPEGAFPEGFRNRIFDSFDDRLEKTGPGTRGYVMRRRNESGEMKRVSFVFFEDTGTAGDGRAEKFGSSFNVEPAYRSDAVGKAFWETVLSSESRDSVITITGDHHLPYSVSDFYVNTQDFYGIGMRDVGGYPLPLLRYDKQVNARLLTRRTEAPITYELASHVADHEIPVPWDEWVAADRTDRDGMPDIITERTGKGFFLTRILADPDDMTRNRAILVFENPSARMNASERRSDSANAGGRLVSESASRTHAKKTPIKNT